MTEAMPFLQKYDITFLRPPPIPPGTCCSSVLCRGCQRIKTTRSDSGFFSF